MTVLIYAYNKANLAEITTLTAILRRSGIKTLIYAATSPVILSNNIEILPDTTQLIDADCVVFPGGPSLQNDVLAQKFVKFLLKKKLQIAAFSTAKIQVDGLLKGVKCIISKEYVYDSFIDCCVDFSLEIAKRLHGNVDELRQVLKLI